MKLETPELAFDPRPRVIVTNGTEEFAALRERQLAGELRILSLARWLTNGQWICDVMYRDELGEQRANK